MKLLELILRLNDLITVKSKFFKKKFVREFCNCWRSLTRVRCNIFPSLLLNIG